MPTPEEIAAAAGNQPPAGSPPEGNQPPAGEFLPGENNTIEIPEKFRVMGEDGKTINHEATLKKVLGSYSEAEKMFGTADAQTLKALLKDTPKLKELIADIPADETGYKLDYSKFPEGMKIDPEREKIFLKSMHGMGISKKQAQGIIEKFGEHISESLTLQQTQLAGLKKEVEGELATAWGDKKDASVNALRVAAKTFFEAEDQPELIGKDLKATYKALLRVLSKVGADLVEDNPPAPNQAAAIDETEYDKLIRSEAYLNSGHAEHDIAVKKAAQYRERKYSKKG